MCCDLFRLYIHFYVICYLCVKCTSHLIKKTSEQDQYLTRGTRLNLPTIKITKQPNIALTL